MTEEKTVIKTIGYRMILSLLPKDFLLSGPGDRPKGAQKFGIGADGLGKRAAAR